jgi:cell wall-associated NlpC family hydrolase
MRCKLLVVAVVVAALFVADQTFLTPKAKAAAIKVSAAAEHRIRSAVNRYAEIQVAQREPYCYSGTGPDCFDCSGLVVASYRWAGINLPVRTSTQMRQWTTGTSLKYARTGDLLFYSGHVEVFYRRNGTGPAMAVAATHTGGPPVNFHPIRHTGLLKVGKAVT